MNFPKVRELDDLSAEEIRALDGGRLLSVLSAVLGVVRTMGELKCDCIDAWANAKIAKIKDPSVENKTKVEDTKRDVDKIAIMIAARKQQSSMLQTLLRSAPQ